MGPDRASASAEDVVKCSSLDGDGWEEPDLAEDQGSEDWVSHGGGAGWGGVDLGSEEEHQGQAQESGDCLQRLDTMMRSSISQQQFEFKLLVVEVDM